MEPICCFPCSSQFPAAQPCCGQGVFQRRPTAADAIGWLCHRAMPAPVLPMSCPVPLLGEAGAVVSWVLSRGFCPAGSVPCGRGRLRLFVIWGWKGITYMGLFIQVRKVLFQKRVQFSSKCRCAVARSSRSASCRASSARSIPTSPGRDWAGSVGEGPPSCSYRPLSSPSPTRCPLLFA